MKTTSISSVHVLPRWFEWWQDHVVLSLLIIAGMILNGLMFAHGIVSNIEDPASWGVFHGIIFGAFFAAGSGLTGVALRASATMGRAFREGRWGMALTNLLVSLLFLPLEFWASVTERSLTHVFTPADAWVLELLGHPDMPVSPTIVAIALASPLILFSWGIVTSPPDQTTAADIAESAEQERARLEADLMLEPLRAKKRAMQVQGVRSAAAAALGRVERREVNPAPPAVTPPLPDVEYTPWELVAKPTPDDDRTPPPSNGGVPTSHPVQNEPPAETATAFVGASYDQNTGEQHSNGRRSRGKTRSVAASRARVRVVGEGMDARRERQRNKAFGILDKDPNINPTALSKRIRSTWRTANRLKNDWLSLQHARQAVQ